MHSPRGGLGHGGLLSVIDLSLQGVGLGPVRGKPALMVDVMPGLEVRRELHSA